MGSRIGLPFASPLMNAMDQGLSPRPGVPFFPEGAGATGLTRRPTPLDIPKSVPLGSGQFNPPQLSAPALPDPLTFAPTQEEPEGDALFFNEQTGEFFVNGFKFAANDYAGALESQKYLGRGYTPPVGEGWRTTIPGEYENFVEQVRDPSLGNLFGAGIRRGVIGSKLLAGSAVQFVGAEALGSDIVESAKKDLARESPFVRRFTEIDDADSAVEWAVSAFGEALPSIFQSVAAGAVGVATGGLAAPALGAGALTLSRFAADKAVQGALQSAIRKRALGVSFSRLSDIEKKAVRTAAMVVGGAAGAIAQNYATGIGDIYQELRESGAPPDSLAARLLTSAGAVPYAAVAAAPEALLMARVFRGTGATGSVFTNVARGAGVGAVAEGASEASQEGIVIGARNLFNDTEWTDEDLVRMVEAGAAGAVVGAPIGGVAGLSPRKNLLALPPPRIITPPPVAPPAGSSGPGPSDPFYYPTDDETSSPGPEEMPPYEPGVGPEPVENKILRIIRSNPDTARAVAPLTSPAATQQPAMLSDDEYRNRLARIIRSNPATAEAAPEPFNEDQYISDRMAEEGYGAPPEPVAKPPFRAVELFKNQVYKRDDRTMGTSPVFVGRGDYMQAAYERYKNEQTFGRGPVLPSDDAALPAYKLDGMGGAPDTGFVIVREGRGENAVENPTRWETIDTAYTFLTNLNEQLQRDGTGRVANITEHISGTGGYSIWVGRPRAEPPNPLLQRVQMAVPAPNMTQNYQPAAARVSPETLASLEASLKANRESLARYEADGSSPAMVRNLKVIIGQQEKLLVDARAGEVTLPEIERLQRALENPPPSGSTTPREKVRRGRVISKRTQLKKAADRVPGPSGKPQRTPAPRERAGWLGNEPIADQDVDQTQPLARTTLPKKEAERKAVRDSEGVDRLNALLELRKQNAAKNAAKAAEVAEPDETTDAKVERGNKIIEAVAERAGVSPRDVLASKRQGQGRVTYNPDKVAKERLKRASKDKPEPKAKPAATPEPKAKPAATPEPEAKPEPAPERNTIANARKLVDEILEGVQKGKNWKRMLSGYVTSAGRKDPRFTSLEVEEARLMLAAMFSEAAKQEPEPAAAEADSPKVTGTKAAKMEAAATQAATPKRDTSEEAATRVEEERRSAVASLAERLVKDAEAAIPAKLSASYTRTMALLDPFIKAAKAYAADPTEANRNALARTASADSKFFTSAFKNSSAYDAILNRNTYVPPKTGKDSLMAAGRKPRALSAEQEALKTMAETEEEMKTAVKLYEDRLTLINSNRTLTDSKKNIEFRKLKAHHEAVMGGLRTKFNNARTMLEHKRREAAMGGRGQKYPAMRKGMPVGGKPGPLSVARYVNYADAITGEPVAPMSRVNVDKAIRMFKLRTEGYATDVLDGVVVAESDEEFKSYLTEENQAVSTDKWYGIAVLTADNKLVINRKRVYNPKILRFAIAHEVLGHFGFRSIMDDATRSAAMAAVEKQWPEFRTFVDRKLFHIMGTPGMDYDSVENATAEQRAIAVEEVLADMAAKLDTSVVRQVWSALRNAVQKVLNIKFRDDLARYMISQARFYVRTGIKPVLTDQHILEISTLVATGRLRALPKTDSFMAARTFAPEEQDLGITASGANGVLGVTMQPNGIAGVADDVRKLGSRANRAFLAALEHLQTTANIASRSDGLSKVYAVFNAIGRASVDLLSNYQSMTPTARTPSFMETPDGRKGANDEDRDIASELLAYSSLHKMAKADDADLAKAPRLFSQTSTGEIVIDPVNREINEAKGLVTAPEFANLEWSFTSGVKGAPYQRDISEDSTAYRIYVENRRAVNQAAIDGLTAIAEAFGFETKERFDDALKKYSFTIEQRQWFEKVLKTYLSLVVDSAKSKGKTLVDFAQRKKYADKWLAGVLRITHGPNSAGVQVGALKLNDWLNGATDAPSADKTSKDANKFVNDFRARADFKELMGGILADAPKVVGKMTAKEQMALNALYNSRVIQFKELREAELATIRTLRGGYVPLLRRGEYEVRVVASVEEGGKTRIVRLERDISDLLPYFQVDHREGVVGEQPGAVDIANKLNEMLGDRTWNLRDDKGNDVKVALTAVHGRARKTASMRDRIDFADFVRVLSNADINLDPHESAKIMQLLEDTQSSLRRTMMRSGTPGWDKNVLQGVDEHLEMKARVSARTRYRYKLDNILNTPTNWKGDPEELARLQQAFDTAPNKEAQRVAEDALVKYAYMYRHMGDERPGPDGEFTITTLRGTKTYKFLGEGNRYFDAANELLRFYAQEPDINVTLDGFLSNDAAPLKMLTTAMLLGGSVASAVLNLTSISTNIMPYLAGFNRDTGRGGGFGDVAAAQEVTRAFGVAARMMTKLNNRASLNSLTTKEWRSYGLSDDEAAFMLKFTAEGQFTPAQTNALIGSQRAKIRNVAAQKALEAWLWLFGKTETVSRVTAGLAAYRLYKARALAAGTDPAAFNDVDSADSEYITQRVNETLTYSVGEYALYNRPSFFRGPIGDVLYVFKQFLVTTTELVRHLPTSEKLKMLAVLTLMAGIKGIPFAEDLFDLIDTLMQKFGIRSRGVELELRNLADTFIPGSSVFVMNGVMNTLLGGTVSTRTGLGDMFPMTGIFKAGADPARELKDAAGPVFGAVAGLGDFAVNLADYALLQKGLNPFATPGKETFADIMRNAPAAGVRSIAEAVIFATDGTVTNSRGQLVTSDLTAQIVMMRALGFYPTVATEMNDVVRLSKDSENYIKLIKKRYVMAYVRAALRDDTERAREVLRAVDEYNRATEGTDFYIDDFRKSAQRALREAERTTVQRYRRTTREDGRATVDDLAADYGFAVD